MLHTEFDEILTAARAGGEWAWSRLYADLAGPIRGYMAARGAREPDDLLGEVFVQMARGLGSFDGDYQGFRSWAFTIAHHRVIDERRSIGRRPQADGADLPDHPAAEDSEAEVMERIGTERVIGILGRLTDDQRDVLALRLIAGMRIGEIAEVTGRRPGAVKQLQRRGLERIRMIVNEEGVPR